MNQLSLKLCFVTLVFLLSVPMSVSAENSHGVSADDPRKIALFENLANAKNELEGRTAEGEIWELWFSQSPSASVRASLDAGLERRYAYDYEAAEAHFDSVIDNAPEYAEGYNQRAFIRFLRQNYEGAATDLEITLKLEPQHFGALSGMHHILMIQNRVKAAKTMLRQAVTVHPWLKERSALPKDMWPEAYRQLHDPGQEI